MFAGLDEALLRRRGGSLDLRWRADIIIRLIIIMIMIIIIIIIIIIITIIIIVMCIIETA